MPETASPALSTYSLIGLVIILSLGLTGYELFKIFGRDFGRTLRNRYALLLGLLNIIVAVLVWLFIHKLLAVTPSIMSALITGLTFPALLRSRFTLYRSIGSGQAGEVDELSLKMDEIYQNLQKAFYSEVNKQLTQARLILSVKVRKTFTARQLERYLDEFIALERLPEEQQKHRDKLNKIKAIQDNKTSHLQLTNLLLDLKTAAEIKQAIKDKSLTGARED
ncbi:MAG TPA: hypothetical protein G4N96_11835 [Chloroflexi bacterium]|nr:hypothetical protein [Chloroflexota bacterium]